MPSHNIKGPKDKLLDTEAHNSVSAVVRANANNWLVNTKALVNKEKSIANQYKIQSATPTFEGKKGFNGLNASDVEAHKNVGVNDQYYNDEVPKMSLVPEIKPVEINTGNASYTSNLGDELISLDRGIQYQTIGHGDGYVEPVEAVDLNKEASTYNFMNSYNDATKGISTSAYSGIGVSGQDINNNLNTVDLNQNLTDEILNTTTEDMETTVQATVQAESAAITEVIESVNAQANEKSELANAGAKLLGIELDNNISASVVDNTQLNTLIEEASSELPYVPYDQKFPTTLEPWGGTHEDNIKMQTVYEPRVQELAAEEQAEKDKILAELQAEKDALVLYKESQAELLAESLALTEENLKKSKLAEGKLEADKVSKEIMKEIKKEEEAEKFQTRSEIMEAKRVKKKLAEEKAAAEQARRDALTSEFEGEEVMSQKYRDSLTSEFEGEEGYSGRAADDHFGGADDAIKAEEARAAQSSLNDEQLINAKNKEKERLNNMDDANAGFGDIVPTQQGKTLISEHLAKLARENSYTADDIAGESQINWNAPKKGTGGINRGKAYKEKYKNDPFRFSTFAYPRDVTTNMENGHYILFYVNVQNKTKYSYDGVTSSGGVVPVGDMIMTEEVRTTTRMDTEYGGASGQAGDEHIISSWKKGASKEFDTNIDYQKRRVLRGSKGNVLRNNMVPLMKGRKSYQGLDSVHKTTTRITDSVALYLPPGVSDNTSVNYSNAEMGMAGFLAFSFGEVVNKWKARDFEGVADTILDVGGTAFTETIKSLSLGAFGMLTGGEDVGSTFDKAFGQTLNPYIEVNFNSMGMRNFDYTFKFSPKSKQETTDVKDIIQLFRFHMAPELKGTNHRYLTLPSTFDIHYMYQSNDDVYEKSHENTFYNKIATCVLTGCNVDYTPNGVRSFEDGAPTQIHMTLSFQETKMLTKQKISDGF